MNMSAAELKKAILEKVETLTDQQLIEVNLFVDAINNNKRIEYDLMRHVEDIIDERKEVLKKLAQ
jgi:hypothetical protein